MKTISILIAFSILLVGFVQSSSAMTIRYALVLGNNVGVDADGKQPFPPLKHAENEARKLKKRLVGLSNFDSSNARTRLLVGATREQLKAAVHALVRQREKDEQLLGKVDTLFLFYFTGHGLQERLLLHDGPISANELGELFNSMGADFSVGVFDACYSGSLDDEALAVKGIDPTPGLNLFRELPEEVLSAEGSIWYVSSGPGQASYEDEKLGGIFTHFFIEALGRAEREGPGITLDRIWQYASKNTVEYTSARNRQQVPQQFISRLKSSSPIYFSFPLKRSATLVLSESIAGEFALAYAEGHLTEVIQKKTGEPREVAIYPGRARLMMIKDEGGFFQKEFNLAPGGELILSHIPEEAPRTAVGQQSRRLWEKGLSAEKTVTATRVGPGLTILGGLGYELDLASKEVLLPRHHFSLGARFDYSDILAGFRVGYGYDQRNFAAWEYRLDAVLGEIHAGYGWDLGPLRLNAAATFGLSHIIQEYGNGNTRKGWQYRPGAQVGLLYPRNTPFVGEFFIHAGPTRSPGAGEKSENIWHFSGGAGLAVYYRLK